MQYFDSTENNFLTIRLIKYFDAFKFILQDTLKSFSYYFITDYLSNWTTQFIIFSGKWICLDSTKTIQLISHFVMIIFLLQVELIIICSHCFLHLDFYYFKSLTCCNHSQFWNKKVILKQRWDTGNENLFLSLFCEALQKRSCALVIC